jgi:hypothetical protein
MAIGLCHPADISACTLATAFRGDKISKVRLKDRYFIALGLEGYTQQRAVETQAVNLCEPLFA